MESPFAREKKSLEDAFYQKETELILKKMRDKKTREERARSLQEILSVKDPELLEKLLELGVTPEAGLAFRLVPLIAVAWADGHLDLKEREAVLKAAETEGALPGSEPRALLEAWLNKPPTEGGDLMDHWVRCMGDLRGAITPAELAALRESLLGSAKRVAASAGGILGIGSVSAAEKAVLSRVEAALA